MVLSNNEKRVEYGQARAQEREILRLLREPDCGGKGGWKYLPQTWISEQAFYLRKVADHDRYDI
jgi:hypothetical protein